MSTASRRGRPDEGKGGRAAGRDRRRRDRHGRGPRGPLAWPAVPAMQTRAARFDELVLDAAQRLESRLGQQLDSVRLSVEEVPGADPQPWASELALGAAFPAVGSDPARVVIYRRPVEARAGDQRELALIVNDVVIEQVAELLGRNPAELDPGYDPE